MIDIDPYFGSTDARKAVNINVFRLTEDALDDETKSKIFIGIISVRRPALE